MAEVWSEYIQQYEEAVGKIFWPKAVRFKGERSEKRIDN
jgi:hypothetical protein